MISHFQTSQGRVRVEVRLCCVPDLRARRTRVNVVVRLNVAVESLLATLLAQLNWITLTIRQLGNDVHAMETIVRVSRLENEATHDSVLFRLLIIKSVESGEVAGLWNWHLDGFNKTALVVVNNVNPASKASINLIFFPVAMSFDILSVELALYLVTSLVSNASATNIEPFVGIHQKIYRALVETSDLFIGQVFDLFVVFVRE